MGKKTEEVAPADRKDKRFRDETWQENPFFAFTKQAYLLNSRYLSELVDKAEGLNAEDHLKLKVYTRQWTDAMSPTNFAMTNPTVLRETLDRNGENLVEGLENMLEDVLKGGEVLSVSNTDKTAFTLGKDIATTKGEVVFQNDLMQLIQYSPSTKDVYQTPLFIVPPWINKYYILDLRPDNSFIKWLVDQGHTVFIASWKNPGKELADTAFEDYMHRGILEGLDAIEKVTGEKETNLIGYCIGGTLTVCTLAYLEAKKQSDRIKSATLLTTLTDFTDVGDIRAFIDADALEALEKKLKERGYLDGSEMAAVFSLLRANEMIWQFMVHNYLLGKDPFPFDLLYWNADSTRLPAQMYYDYIKQFYIDNALIKKGSVTFAGEKLDISNIKTPLYMLSTREDHIAPWRSTYELSKHVNSPIRFVLAASGHVAGVVSPPGKHHKYGHWVNDSVPKTPDAWLDTAKEVHDSWWKDWNAWVDAGKKVAARKPKGGKEHAPGSYVKET